MKGPIVIVLSVLHLALLVVARTGPTSSNGRWQADKIDTHCHFIPAFFRDFEASHNVTLAGYGPIPDWNVSLHLAFNAEFGIKTCVLSAQFSTGAVGNVTIEEARALAREINEYAHNLTVYYPENFKFFATLPLPDVDGAVAEAIYALDTLGAAGVIILGRSGGVLLGNRSFDPLYKVLDERKAVVFVHPSGGAPTESSEFDLPPFVVDFLLETTSAALNLVFTNTTTDYPNMKILLAHSGGFLPFALTRAANALALTIPIPSANGTTILALAGVYIDKLKRMYGDLGISANIYALPSTTTFFKKKHITYGTDFPYFPTYGIAQNNEGFLDYFSSKARDRISYKNAGALFGHRL